MSPERLAFLLMPFGKESDGIYENLIKPTLADAGYSVARADTPMTSDETGKSLGSWGRGD